MAWGFWVFGAFWGSWAVSAADVERTLHLSHGWFGVLLSLALLGGGVTNALGGSMAERYGTGPVFAAALACWAALLVAGALAPPRLALEAVLVAVVAAGGFVDVVMNVAATAAFADAPGSLVRFHAQFNAGAAGGAALAGVVLAKGGSWRWLWAIAAVLATVVALSTVGRELPAGAPGADGGSLASSIRVLRAERLVLVAVAFALGAMVEGGLDLWGVLFLRTYLRSGIALAAISAGVAYAVAATARAVLGPRAARRGARRGVTVGAITAVAGIVIVTASQSAGISAIGLVLAAGGISMCWPLLLAVASAGRDRPGTVVGGVSAVGYLGLVFGPTVVGWLGAAFGLRIGLLFLAGAGAFVAIVPRWSRTRSRNA